MRVPWVSLREQARRRGRQPAILTGDERLTYAALWRAAVNLAARLRAAGLGAGDRVAFIGVNGPEPAIAYYAASAIQAVMAMIPTDRPVDGLRPLVDLVDPGAVVLGRTPTGARYRRAWGQRLATPSTRAVIEVEPGSGTPRSDHPPTRREDVAGAPHLILFTGGTTGQPKGVLHLEDRYVRVTEISVRRLEITAADVLVNPYPAYHYGGLQAINQTVLSGATLVQLPVPDAAAIAAAIDRHRGTFIVAVPTVWRRLLASAGLAAHDLSSLRMANVASDFVPVELMEAVRERTGAVSVQGYGSTETGMVTLVDVAMEMRKRASCGSADPVSEIEIVDDRTRPLPPGRVGNVRVRSDHMMAGYFRNEPATAAAFDGEWFETGDLGHLDDDGYLYITGRKKNVIACGAEKFVPEEIEAVLLELPGVASALVVGVPDPDLGEVPVALARVSAGARLTVDDLVAHTSDRLGAARRVRGALFVGDPLLTDLGKPDRERAAAIALEAYQGLGVGRASLGRPVETPGRPLSELEASLAGLWSELLGVDGIRSSQSFFDLGGTSLLAVRMIVEAEEMFDVELDPESLTRAPTVETLAALIARARR